MLALLNNLGVPNKHGQTSTAKQARAWCDPARTRLGRGLIAVVIVTSLTTLGSDLTGTFSTIATAAR
jgi:hypothetical protein